MALLWTCSSSSLSFLCWGSRAGCRTPGGSHQSGVEGQNPLPRPNGHPSCDTAQEVVGLWAASAHCRVMPIFSSTAISKSFSAGLLSIPSSPSLYCYQGLPRPRCKTLYLALLNLMKFMQALFSSLSGWHPVPQACQLHHPTWCLIQFCV